MSWESVVGDIAPLVVGGVFGLGTAYLSGFLSRESDKTRIAHEREMRVREEQWKIADEILAIATATHGAVSVRLLLANSPLRGSKEEVQEKLKERVSAQTNELIELYQDQSKLIIFAQQIDDDDLTKAVDEFTSGLINAYTSLIASLTRHHVEISHSEDRQEKAQEIEEGLQKMKDKQGEDADGLDDGIEKIGEAVARIKGTLLTPSSSAKN